VTPATTNTPSASAFQLLLTTATPVVRGALATVTDATVVDAPASSSVGEQLVHDIADAYCDCT